MENAAHQHSNGSNQHTPTSAQRAPEHETGAECKQGARDKADCGEDVNSSESNSTLCGVVLDPFEEAL